MRIFVINLDSAPERWAAIEGHFAGSALEVVRVPGVDGNTLVVTPEDFAEKRFRLFHGRAINPREIGCYLGHVRAMEAFLASGDAHGVIAEDDLVPQPGWERVLAEAMARSGQWNVLRLSGLGEGVPLAIAALGGTARLCVSLGRVKGAGAYVLDRKAAAALVRDLRPMWLPFDHAIDREWHQGLRAAYVLPFPFSQTDSGFRSQIQKGKTGKTGSNRRWLTTYPYQAFNEMGRYLFRSVAYLRAKRAESGPKIAQK